MLLKGQGNIASYEGSKLGMEEDKKKSIQVWGGTLKSAVNDADNHRAAVEMELKRPNSTTVSISNMIWTALWSSPQAWFGIAVFFLAILSQVILYFYPQALGYTTSRRNE